MLRIFTSSEEVLQKASSFYYWVILMLFLDFNQCQIQGAIKAIGQQKLASTINFITYFCIGLPTSYFLAFNDLRSQFLNDYFGGLCGIMVGMTLAILLNCTGFFMIVWGPGSSKRWRQAINDAQHRNQAQPE